MKVFATLLAMLLATGMNNVAIANTDPPLVTVDDDKNPDEGSPISKNKAVIGVVIVGAVVIAVLGGRALAKRMKGSAKKIATEGGNLQGSEVIEESEITAFNELLDDHKRLSKKFLENPDDEQALKEVTEAAERIDAMVKEAGSDERARRLAVISIEATADAEGDPLLKNLQEANTPAAQQEAKEAIEEAIEGVSEGLAQLRARDHSELALDDLAKQIVESNLPDPRKTYDNFEAYAAAHKNAAGTKSEAELREQWDNYDEIFATRVEELTKNLANDSIEIFERSLNKLRSATEGSNLQGSEVIEESEITAFNELLDDHKRLGKKFLENPDDEQALKEVTEAAERIEAMVKEAGSDELARRATMPTLEAMADAEADPLLKNLQEANTPAARQEAKEAIEEAIEGVNEGLAQLRAGDYSELDLDDLAKQIVESNLPDPRKTYDNFEAYAAAHKNAAGTKSEAELREQWDNYDEIFATRVEELTKNLANDSIEIFERSLNKLRSATEGSNLQGTKVTEVTDSTKVTNEPKTTKVDTDDPSDDLGEVADSSKVTEKTEITAFNEQLDDFKRLTKKSEDNPGDEQAKKEMEEAAERIGATIEETGSDELARRFMMSLVEDGVDVGVDELIKDLQEANTPAARRNAKEAIKKSIEGINEELAELRAGDYGELGIDDIAEGGVKLTLPDPRKTYDKLEDYIAAHKNATGAKSEAELRELWDNYDSIFATRVEESRKNVTNDMIEMLERLLNKLRSAVQ